MSKSTQMMRITSALAALTLAGSAAAASGSEQSPAGLAIGGQTDPAADAAPAADSDAQPDSEDDAVGLDLGVTVGSVYNWRGLNTYQLSSQHDQFGQVAPSITYTVPGSGLSLNYWSSYQMNGENASLNVDSGIGAEQDVTVKYAFELGEDASLSPFVAAYTYPFAKKEDAGVAFPVYLEPALELEYATFLDLSLLVSYTQGLQSEISEFRYVYQHAGLSRDFDLGAGVSVGGGGGYGFKVFFDDTVDNAHDTQVDANVSWETAGVTFTPAVHWAWSNFSEVTFTDEQFAWASLDVGYSL